MGSLPLADPMGLVCLRGVHWTPFGVWNPTDPSNCSKPPLEPHWNTPKTIPKKTNHPKTPKPSQKNTPKRPQNTCHPKAFPTPPPKTPSDSHLPPEVVVFQPPPPPALPVVGVYRAWTEWPSGDRDYQRHQVGGWGMRWVLKWCWFLWVFVGFCWFFVGFCGALGVFLLVFCWCLWVFVGFWCLVVAFVWLFLVFEVKLLFSCCLFWLFWMAGHSKPFWSRKEGTWELP